MKITLEMITKKKKTKITSNNNVNKHLGNALVIEMKEIKYILIMYIKLYNETMKSHVSY